MTIELDIEEGDIILTGKFKNKRTVVKSIGSDEDGHPTINGKPILKFKIEKFLSQEDKSKKTREQQQETVMNKDRFRKLAGLLNEQTPEPDALYDSEPGSEDFKNQVISILEDIQYRIRELERRVDDLEFKVG